ncbi:hypothetical protein BgiBS90_038515 [Biomphalaria glabrata]|nr:hypothetical protein BgiBS90_038515 [Biomphalaria glabrata]
MPAERCRPSVEMAVEVWTDGSSPNFAIGGVIELKYYNQDLGNLDAGIQAAMYRPDRGASLPPLCYKTTGPVCPFRATVRPVATRWSSLLDSSGGYSTVESLDKHLFRGVSGTQLKLYVPQVDAVQPPPSRRKSDMKGPQVRVSATLSTRLPCQMHPASHSPSLLLHR